MTKTKKNRYLTTQQEADILSAGMTPRDLPAFRKGKPYVLPGALTIYRLVNGTLCKSTYENSAKLASAIAKLRDDGVAMSKVCLKELAKNGYELSAQERDRITPSKKKKRGILLCVNGS